MKKVMQGALFLGLLAGVVYVIWNLRGTAPEEEPAASKAEPAAARPARRPAASSSSAAVDLPGSPAFAEDRDPEGTLQLEGQVLAEGDLPAGKASVTINSTPKRTVTAEEDGSFVFDKLVGRTYILVARSGDMAGGPVMHQLTASSEPAVIRLRAGATLEVTVVTAEGGKPLPGATVGIRTHEKRQATADARGKAVFRGVRDGGKVVVAWADGYAPSRRFVSVPRGADAAVTARLALRKGVAVSGRVQDSMGKPIEGATVAARAMADLHGGLSRKAMAPVKSDASGAFTLAAVAPGTYRLSARHKTHAPGTSKPVTVGTTPVDGVTISLEAGATVAGKVVSVRGEVVPWATVRVGPHKVGLAGRLSRFRKATADAEGAFRVEGLAREKVSVAASAEGGSSKIITVDLTEKPTQEGVLLKLEHQGIIAGVVVNGAGEPVPEAQVSAIPDVFARGAFKQLYMRGLGGQLTDGGGQFKFTGLPDGTFRLRVSRSGVSRRLYRLNRGVEARTGQKNVRLVLEQPGSLKGKAQDGDGAPVKAFTVTVSEPPGRPVVDDQGRFELRDLPPGTYDITISSAGHAPAIKRGVKIEASGTTDLGSVTLSRGRSVSGTVLDARGGPVSGATVVVGKKLVGDGKSMLADLGRAFAEASGIRKGTSAEDGSYTVSGIDAKAAQLIAAEHPRLGRSAAQPVAPGKEDARAELKLLPMGSLQGKVTFGKKPAGGVMVVATQKGSRNQSLLVTTDAEGLYLFERLPAGGYDLMAMSKAGLGGKSGGAKVVVEPERRATADINVEAGDIDLVVAVKGEGGAKIALSQVFLFKGGPSPKNGKQVQEAFLGKAKGGGAMMAFAKGPGGAEFKQVSPAAYSLCVLPINGDLHDASFRARLQKHADKLAVHCRPHTVTEAPSKQKVEVTVPPMAPLPEEKPEE